MGNISSRISRAINKQPSLDELPDDAIIVVLKQLALMGDYRAVCCFCCTSRRFRSLSQDPRVWTIMVQAVISPRARPLDALPARKRVECFVKGAVCCEEIQMSEGSFHLGGQISFIASPVHQVNIPHFPKCKKQTLTCFSPEVDFLGAQFLAVSSDLTRAISGRHSTLRFWDLKEEVCLQQFQTSSYLTALAMTPDATTVIAGYVHGELSVWNSASNLTVVKGIIPGEALPINSLVPSSDHAFAISSNHGFVRAWRLADLSPHPTFPGYEHDKVMCVALSADDTIVASGCAKSKIQVWSFDPPEQIALFTAKSSIESLLFAHSQKRIFAGMLNGCIDIWDIESQSCLTTLPKVLSLAGTTKSITALSLSPDETQLLSKVAAERVVLYGF